MTANLSNLVFLLTRPINPNNKLASERVRSQYEGLTITIKRAVINHIGTTILSFFIQLGQSFHDVMIDLSN